jgi:DNA-binding transcriptional ArsR family regulator
MSSEVGELRALAHPIRLRMSSLLTNTTMSAAELARELDITHANASYHVRRLHRAGLVKVAEERRNRGGLEKRYTVDLEATLVGDDSAGEAWFGSLANELVRRAPLRRVESRRGNAASADAELWVAPAVWRQVVAEVRDAMTTLHQAAQAPRAKGTQPVSATVALFRMRS